MLVSSEAHLLPRPLIAVQPSNCLVEQSKCPGTGCTGSGRKPRLTLFFTVKYGEIRNANHRHVACLDCVWLSCFKFLLICHQVQKCFFLAKTGKNRRSPEKLRRKKKTPVTPLYLLLQASSLKTNAIRWHQNFIKLHPSQIAKPSDTTQLESSAAESLLRSRPAHLAIAWRISTSVITKKLAFSIWCNQWQRSDEPKTTSPKKKTN